jgi:truncated hemoglobin YjbI
VAGGHCVADDFPKVRRCTRIGLLAVETGASRGIGPDAWVEAHRPIVSSSNRKIMMNAAKSLLGTLALCSLLAACGDDGGGAPDARRADARELDADTTTLYGRLGGEAGVTAVIDDFLPRVLANPAINGYFLNEGANHARLRTCLIKQVSAAGGAPGVRYPQGDDPDDGDGCRNMKKIHATMGISQVEFDALAGDLVEAMTTRGVAEADRTAVLGAVMPLSTEIVEDADNSATIYQRIGRRPNIENVIDRFVAKVVANVEINGFFAGASDDALARFEVCLVRQLCDETGGPCVYGGEITNPYEAGVADDDRCKPMLESHQDLEAGGSKIDINDFNSLVADLSTALDEGGVDPADKSAILTVLGGFCSDIVHAPSQGSGCPSTID